MALTSTVKRLASVAAERLGYTIVPTWLVETYPGLTHLRRLLDLLSVDLVIDVGGNAGQFRDTLRAQIGYQGRIITFEPTPHHASVLLERAKSDPLWTVDPRALGSSQAMADFNIMDQTEFSSFLTPNHTEYVAFDHMNKIRETIAVEVTTIDNVMPEIVAKYAPKSIFLKIDTQGYELEVLKGATASLPTIRAFQAEVAFRKIYKDAPIYHDVIEYASSQGFVMSGLFRNDAGQFPEIADFDCYMIHPSASSK